MKHYLVTQFNCDLYDLDWLKKRQVLFERFCLPSVEAQTNKNFEWLLMSDSRTPDEFRKVLDSYPATVIYHDFENHEWDFRVPMDHDSIPEGSLLHFAIKLESIGDIVANAIGDQDTDYIITSRCDNDDAISFDHIERIQKKAELLWRKKGPYKFWLSFVRGCKWNENNVYPHNSRFNSFLSFVEDPKDLQTCYMCCHTQSKASGHPVETFREGEPTWMEVIHGGNKMNRLKRVRGKQPDTEARKRFNIK